MKVRQTFRFARWLAAIADESARARILVRIRRLSLGNPGDVRSVVSVARELRVEYGPGYRVYFCERDLYTVILVVGGEKAGQAQDMKTAIRLASSIGDD